MCVRVYVRVCVWACVCMCVCVCCFRVVCVPFDSDCKRMRYCMHVRDCVMYFTCVCWCIFYIYDSFLELKDLYVLFLFVRLLVIFSFFSTLDGMRSIILCRITAMSLLWSF